MKLEARGAPNQHGYSQFPEKAANFDLRFTGTMWNGSSQ